MSRSVIINSNGAVVAWMLRLPLYRKNTLKFLPRGIHGKGLFCKFYKYTF
jgi:hypothetical protein